MLANVHITQCTLTADDARMLCWTAFLLHIESLFKKLFNFFIFSLAHAVESQIGQFWKKQQMMKWLQCARQQKRGMNEFKDSRAGSYRSQCTDCHWSWRMIFWYTVIIHGKSHSWHILCISIVSLCIMTGSQSAKSCNRHYQTHVTLLMFSYFTCLVGWPHTGPNWSSLFKSISNAVNFPYHIDIAGQYACWLLSMSSRVNITF